VPDLGEIGAGDTPNVAIPIGLAGLKTIDQFHDLGVDRITAAVVTSKTQIEPVLSWGGDLDLVIQNRVRADDGGIGVLVQPAARRIRIGLNVFAAAGVDPNRFSVGGR